MDRCRVMAVAAAMVTIAMAATSAGVAMAQPLGTTDDRGLGDGCDSGQSFPVTVGQTVLIGCASFGGANWCRRQDSSFVLCPELPIPEDLSEAPGDFVNYDISAHQLHEVSPGKKIIVTEIMAMNDGFLADEEGQFPDWIEIHNAEEENISLEGWSITDDLDEPRKWEFPDVLFIGGGYHIVFASGKDKKDNPQFLHSNFRLKSDGEFIAVVRPDGTVASAVANEFPRQIPNVAYGIPDVKGLPEAKGLKDMYTFLKSPTPAAPNSPPRNNGPFVSSVKHDFGDQMPPAGSDLLITAIVTEFLHPIDSVVLTYRRNYQKEETVFMTGDPRGSVFTAVIPADAFDAGDMVRWFLTAEDIEGNTSRDPPFVSKEYPQYYGTVIKNPEIRSALPILYWFTRDSDKSTSEKGLQGSSVYYNGQFYDNVFTRRRGVTALSWPKPKIKFDFKGKVFEFTKDYNVEEFNLQSFWEEPGEDTYLREPLTFKVMNEAGLPSSESFHVRVHQNGQYYGLFAFVEQVDDSFLEKHGRKVSGPLFKSIGELSNFRWDLKLQDLPFTYRKGNRQEVVKDWDYLLELIQSLGGGGELARSKFIFDRLDLPQIINYLAINSVVLNQDRCAKNFYSYMDPITLRWTIFPWDVENAFGISSGLGGEPTPDFCILVCEQWNSPLYCDSDHPQELAFPFAFGQNGRRLQLIAQQRLKPKKFKLPSKNEYDEDVTSTRSLVGAAGSYNHLDDAILDWPVTREMYFRRLRTLMDQFMNGRLEKMITEMYNLIREEAIVDNNKWGVTPDPTAVDRGYKQLMEEQLPTRRAQLYELYGPGGVVELIPDEQPSSPDMDIVRVDVTPENPMEQYIEIRNPNGFAVDLTGWRLIGSTVYIFPPGAVVVAGGNAFLSPDIVSFHSRVESPKGGEGNFVLGPYPALDPTTQISLILMNDQGNTITSA